MWFRSGFGLFAFAFEIDLPGEFVFFAIRKIVFFTAPPILLGLKFFQTNGFGFAVAFVTRWIGVLVKPDGVGVKVFTAIVNPRAFGKKQQVGFNGGGRGSGSAGGFLAEFNVDGSLLHVRRIPHGGPSRLTSSE